MNALCLITEVLNLSNHEPSSYIDGDHPTGIPQEVSYETMPSCAVLQIYMCSNRLGKKRLGHVLSYLCNWCTWTNMCGPSEYAQPPYFYLQSVGSATTDILSTEKPRFNLVKESLGSSIDSTNDDDDMYINICRWVTDNHNNCGTNHRQTHRHTYTLVWYQ